MNDESIQGKFFIGMRYRDRVSPEIFTGLICQKNFFLLTKMLTDTYRLMRLFYTAMFIGFPFNLNVSGPEETSQNVRSKAKQDKESRSTISLLHLF